MKRPSVPGSCNYDSGGPKRNSNVSVMGRGSADETIVGVKSIANEGAVTYLRVKLSKSDTDVGAEGWNMLLEFGNLE